MRSMPSAFRDWVRRAIRRVDDANIPRNHRVKVDTRREAITGQFTDEPEPWRGIHDLVEAGHQRLEPIQIDEGLKSRQIVVGEAPVVDLAVTDEQNLMRPEGAIGSLP